MGSRMIDWDDLKLVHAVIDAGGLSAAARSLGTTQPTIGRRIQALEEQLGCMLFERRSEGYRPTAVAHALLPHLASMAEAATLVEREIQVQADQGSGLVRVAASSWMSRFLVERLARLRASLPDIEIALDSDGRLPQLGTGDVHMAIFTALPPQPGLKSRIICRSAYAIYGARSYVAAHPAASTEERFTLCDWVMFDLDRVPSLNEMDWFAGRLGPKVRVLRTTTTATVLSALEGGAGLGLLPCFVGDRSELLVRVSPIQPAQEHVYRLFLHQDIARAPRVRKTADAIGALFESERALLLGKSGSPAGKANNG
jgi:DNA-binding transcriptional LysR family regulator